MDITADILNGKTVTGTITSISPTGRKNGKRSTERVVPATVSIDKEDSADRRNYGPGSIVTERAEDVFKVPSSAVRTGEDGSSQIAVLKEGTGSCILFLWIQEWRAIWRQKLFP